MVEYRFTLTRDLGGAGDGPSVCWVMLNPSTADETGDDQTIRRTIGFSRAHGFRRLIVVNLFAARATHPIELQAMLDPVGEGNDEVIAHAVAGADEVVVAWGAIAAPFTERVAAVNELLRIAPRQPKCLGITRYGHPRHPCRIRSEQRFVPFPCPTSTTE